MVANSLQHIENHLHATEPRWFAVKTKFKHEKMAFDLLLRNQIDAYLPLRKLTRRYHRKVRHVDMPLIHSFVFVKVVKKQYIRVLETEYVGGFLRFGKNLLAIPDEQIQILHRLTGEEIPLEVEPNEFRAGVEVEVVAGVLMGMRGRLVSFKGKDKLEIALTNFEHSLLIDIDKKYLNIIR
jgi:transcription antitermination factor NusG